MSTDQQQDHAALTELLQEKAQLFAEQVAALGEESEWVQQMEELRRAPVSQQLASLRLSVAIGALDADTALLLMAAFRSRPSRVDELTDAVIELKQIAARPAQVPMTLRVKRDAAGNALEYRQEPAEADVGARDFVQRVAELHKRARGSNGTG